MVSLRMKLSIAWLAAGWLCVLHAYGQQTTTLVLQNGRSISGANYNGTQEALITTQYVESWNLNNGQTRFGLDGNGLVMEAETKFRYLVKFQDIHKLVPAGATIVSASLTMTFVVWADAPPWPRIDGCFMGAEWDAAKPAAAPAYASLGWRFRKWDTATRKSVAWKKAGGWDDCATPSPAFTFSKIRSYAHDGYVTSEVALDPAKVNSWLASSGAANYGLLLRAAGPYAKRDRIEVVGAQVQAPRTGRRPFLTLTYATSPSAPKPAPLAAATASAGRTIWVDPATGDDERGSGAAQYPLRSANEGLFQAAENDTVLLKSGVYPGRLRITRPNITLASAPGHWAVISAPINVPQIDTALTIREGAVRGTLRDLELTGGFFYALSFWNWDGAKDSARDWTVSNVRLHSSGAHLVKLAKGVNRVTFRGLHAFKSGLRVRTGGHGVYAVAAHAVRVEDSYFHDLPGAAVSVVAGSQRALIQRNYVERCGSGINVGFAATQVEDMATEGNPKLYEALHTVVRNNVVASTWLPALSVWAALNTSVLHNTLRGGLNGETVVVNSQLRDDTPAVASVSSRDLYLRANILVRPASAPPGQLVQIRNSFGPDAPGLDPAGVLQVASNIMWSESGAGGSIFKWGVGAMIEDERGSSYFQGNVTGWQVHCASTLKQVCTPGNMEADPVLAPDMTPLLPCTAAAKAVPTPVRGGGSAGVNGPVRVTDDFHGRKRPVAGAQDVGAIALDCASGALKPVPPVPQGLLGKPAPYTGAPPALPIDRAYPYGEWASRACLVLKVNANSGNDATAATQLGSAAFKTVQAAVDAALPCDIIALAGGQTHVGPVAVRMYNLTIRTDPTTSGKAVLSCPPNNRDQACVFVGEGGNTEGGPALTLENFDIRMTGGAPYSCVHINEGSGGGTTPWWTSYIVGHGWDRAPTATRRDVRVTTLRNIAMSGCGEHGLKLSTYIHDVRVTGITIDSVGGSGIVAVSSNSLVVEGCTLTNLKGSGIILTGGSRGARITRNTIRFYGDRGIQLGGDETQPEYMDAAWALGPGGSWHDAVGAVVSDNRIENGVGAGLCLMSARDCVLSRNTMSNVSVDSYGGLTYSVSPKVVGIDQEVGPACTNITVNGNTVGVAASRGLAVEVRALEATMGDSTLASDAPTPVRTSCANAAAPTCPGARPSATAAGRRAQLRGGKAQAAAQALSGRALRGAAAATAGTAVVQAGADDAGGGEWLESGARRSLKQAGTITGRQWALQQANLPGVGVRAPDGSCPITPDTSPWRRDISQLPVHPRSEQIKRNIGGGGMHPDFAGSEGEGARRVWYGIPFVSVDTRTTPSLLTRVTIRPEGYEDESDPGLYPIPADAPVEGAYPGCSLSTCRGDRHVLVVDQATCTLYELYVAEYSAGRWSADQASMFNLTSNRLRPYGWTSADAAGLPVLPGLVTFDDVVTRGLITRAMRFTGPNSRRAYEPPATHFAAAGDADADNPWMGMRVRLSARYDCTARLRSRVARVICEGMKKHGLIFADNGGPWFITGESTPKWAPYANDVAELGNIRASDMEVVDTGGCLCLNAPCTILDCGSGSSDGGGDGGDGGGDNTTPVSTAQYPGVANLTTDVRASDNLYYNPGGAARFVDRRVPGGMEGGLADWVAYSGEVRAREGPPAGRRLKRRLQG